MDQLFMFDALGLQERQPMPPEPPPLARPTMWTGAPVNKWCALSGLHKELRRGDPHAANFWCRFTERPISGNKFYAQSIIFEETRNVSLYMHFLENWNRLSLFEVLDLFSRTAKKWEVASRDGCYEEFVASRRRWAGNGGASAPTTGLPWDRMVKSINGLGDAYDLFWISRTPNIDPADYLAFQYAIRSAGERHRDPAIQKFCRLDLKHWKFDPFYTSKLVLEALGGIDTSDWCEMREIRPWVSSDASYATDQVPLYVYDVHGRDGERLMCRHGEEMLATRKCDSLDLRFSGMILGVAWRELVGRFQKWGSMNWTAAKFTDTHWTNVLAYDAACYNRWYEKSPFRSYVK